MSKIRKNKGFTLAEVLIVVALIGVLSGVAFIAVWSHLRSMAQLERDTIAKEIYVAAQNHLTSAKSQGYLNLEIDEYGIPGTSTGDQDPKDKNRIVSYYLVAPNVGSTYQKIYDLMLPFGAVDETVLAGGSYIIRYQPTSASVLDVFYCVKSGRFAHTFTDTEYKALVDEMRDVDKDGNSVDKKSARRNYGTDNAVIGWYGGENTVTVGERLNVPSIEIINAERLQVKVTDNNNTDYNNDLNFASLKLIVEGVKSTAKKAFSLSATGGRVVAKNGSTYTITLDEITNSTTGFHFCDLEADTTEKFIPGENIKVYAVSYSNSVLTNIAKSTEGVTNSLFGYDPKADQETAQISNIRHLENLDYRVSHVAVEAGKTKNAVQTTDLIWKKKDSTESGLKNPDGFVDIIGATIETGNEVKIYPVEGNNVLEECFFPVSPGNTDVTSPFALNYNGNNHSISNVTVNYAGDAGIFGSLNNGKVSNLLIANSTIASSSSSGAAGGLIGNMTGTTVERCAANGTVSSSGAAGGLIGSADSGRVTACYSAGHTKDGSYQDWVDVVGHTYDVSGATAGGLIGSSKANISDSYSTCSVSGTSAAGGFVGNAEDGSDIGNCYAVGLVKTDPVGQDSRAENRGAFAGTASETAAFSGCQYYGIINEVKRTETGADTTVFDHYLGAVGDAKEAVGGITEIDLSAQSYDTFVGAPDTWTKAEAHDTTLKTYYQKKYNLKGISRLDTSGTSADGETDGTEPIVYTHYGDWPAPEIFVINTQ